MPVVRRACALALLVTSLTACTSVSGSPDGEPTPTLRSLTDLAAEDLTVLRGDFCASVAPSAVEDALGAEPDDSVTWRNGDRAAVVSGVSGAKDVVHEYGCAWTAGDAAALAWVFAPPVSPARARELGRATADAEGCREVADPGPFGERSVAVTCRSDGGPTTTYQGLFGDAWLSCSVSGGETKRAERWCAAAVQAASA